VPTEQGRRAGAIQANDSGQGRNPRSQEEMHTMSKKLLISLAPLVAIIAFAMMPVAAQAAKCVPFTPGSIPHYCANGTRLPEFGPGISGSTKTPIIQWAKLTLGSGAAAVSCKNAVAGNVWNPEGVSPNVEKLGPAGKGEVELFATYECTVAACPLETRVTAENLPWPYETYEGTAPDPAGTLRVKNTGIRVKVGCYFPNPFPSNEAAKGQPAAVPLLFGGPGTPGGGENNPKLSLGSSGCNKPGLSLFTAASGTDAGSGELEEETGGEGRSSSPYPVKGAETGTGTGVKSGTTGTVKTCGFNNSELINAEN